ncbi:MAG: type II toxin-antitoxin system VapB family antitoxin [Bryobacteraceae bacterium]
MGLNIKNPEVEQLATEVALLAQESKTEAIKQALLERRTRLLARKGTPSTRGGLRQYLEESVWPYVPAGELGRTLTRQEEDEILGYGREGF